MSDLFWIQTVWHSDGIPERSFNKNLILKKSADDKYPVGKELKHYVLVIFYH